jgi:hypothetical protein
MEKFQKCEMDETVNDDEDCKTEKKKMRKERNKLKLKM